MGTVYKKYGRCIVAVSEGIHDKDGKPIVESLVANVERDSHGNVQLSGTGILGDTLAGLVRDKVGIKRVRCDTFGYLQRCFPGIVSDVDAVEARRVGEVAVNAAVSGQDEGSVAIRRVSNKPYKVEYEIVGLEQVAKHTNAMSGEFIEGENNISQKFFEYALPLIGELPEIGRLRDVSIVGSKRR